MTFQDESTDHYENALIELNGLELKLGVIDDFEYAIHLFKWTKFVPAGVAFNETHLIHIDSLIKGVGEYKNQYLDSYGAFVIDVLDIPALSSSLRKVRDDLQNGIVFERDPEWIQDNTGERDWLEHGLQTYGGELVFCENRHIQSHEYKSDVESYEILAHVHQWRNRPRVPNSEIKNNMLISGYSKNLSIPNSEYDSHGYCSVFITLEKVEEFISLLEKMAADISRANEEALG